MNRRLRALLRVRFRRWPIGVRIVTRLRVDGALTDALGRVALHSPFYPHCCLVEFPFDDSHRLVPFRLMRRMNA